MYLRRKVPLPMCGDKRRYATSREAEDALLYRRKESGDDALEMYPCSRCGGWHLGHGAPQRRGRL